MANSIDRFEACNGLYYRATGCQRPGKDEPLETGRDANSEENRERFEQWFMSKSWAAALDRIVELETRIRVAQESGNDI